MLEAGPSESSLLVSIVLSVDLSGPPITISAVIGLISSGSPPPPLMLATIIVSQLVDRLMKWAMVAVEKGKSVVPVLAPLVELAKPPVKVAMGLI